MRFKAIKREFKHGQPCRTCHKKLSPNKMTVDHIIPVADPRVDPFDMLNWQVLCLPCHRKKTHRENLARHKARLDWRPHTVNTHQEIKKGIVS